MCVCVCSLVSDSHSSSLEGPMCNGTLKLEVRRTCLGCRTVPRGSVIKPLTHTYTQRTVRTNLEMSFAYQFPRLNCKIFTEEDKLCALVMKTTISSFF